MSQVIAMRMPQFHGREWVLDEMSGNDPAAMAEAAAALARFSSHEWIGDVDVPTAVVVTERDGLVPRERQRRLAESIRGARVFPVDGDHSVCVSAPHLFIPALQSALTAVTTIAARPI